MRRRWCIVTVRSRTLVARHRFWIVALYHCGFLNLTSWIDNDLYVMIEDS